MECRVVDEVIGWKVVVVVVVVVGERGYIS